MKRGEIWWVDFNPSRNGEIRKKRSAVIVSNDSSNHFLNRVQVIPLTSNVKKLYPNEAFITIQGKQNKAMADQITTVSKSRLSNRIGKVDTSDMTQIENAIKIQLALQ